MKTVYIAISADILHHGHINLIKKASEYGDLIVGILTDETVATYKRFPVLEYEQRKFIIENINGVKDVVPQYSLDYTENLEKYKPDYVFHGDDWKEGIQSKIRQNVIKTLSKWGGELIEIPFTEDVSIDKINDIVKSASSIPESRRSKLKKLISLKPIVRTIEAHNGLSALVVENAKVILKTLEEQQRVNLGAAPKVVAKAPAEEELQLSFASSNKEAFIERVKDIDVNTLTPIEALTKLFELQKEAQNI